MNLILKNQIQQQFFAIVAALVCNWLCELGRSYNALAMRKGVCFSVHCACILPKDAYPKQGSEGHQQLTADHGGQLADHYQEPVVIQLYVLSIVKVTRIQNLSH